jgi:hypothetical protein
MSRRARTVPRATAPKAARTSRAAAIAGLCADDVETLRAAALRFGPETEAAKAAQLSACATRTFGDARTLIAYHDVLLFLLAYPSSPALRAAAERELARVARASCAIAADGPARQRQRLEGSGIAGCEVSAAFSHELSVWLQRRYRDRAEISGIGDDARLTEVLALCLPRMEAELTAAATDALRLLDEVRGERDTRLGWLLRALGRLPVPPDVRAHLFESAQPFVTIRPGSTPLSRTFARGPCGPVWYHTAPLDKQPADATAEMRAPLPQPRALGAAESATLIDTARASLAMLARETDPVTWPSPAGVMLYEFERGAAVALYAMDPARRFALDSHTGYLMLKNGVPVGYGGGWPFLATCRTGTNIFAPFRGGESSWLFAQVLRAYRQHFGVKRFVVEPYQFGAGNREGLLSGAFWFYYRLGFRPIEREAARLARAEFTRMARKGYRPPLPTLRALTVSDLALDLEPVPAAERCEPADLSFAVSQWTRRAHGGDRKAAAKDAVARVSAALGVTDLAGWPRAEQDAFRSLALVIGLIPDLARWNEREREACVALMRAKGAPEDAAYFRALAAHPRLPTALARVASRAGGVAGPRESP